MAKSELDIVLKVTDKASRGLRSVGGSLGSIGKMAAVGGAAAIAAIGAIGAGVLKLASDAQHVPGITAAFESLTKGISGGSDKMLKALQKASNGMVSNTELMRQFNLANQLVGEDFAENLPNAMEPLGKVAAATGQDMGFLMDSLIRGVGRLSPLILDNLGIQVDLNQAYQDWADANGRTVDSMTKAEQQAALMGQAMTLLQSNTEQMPGVAGSAAQQMAAFGATLQNAKDSIGVALIPALTSLVGALTPIIEEYGPQIAEWLGENLPIAMAATADFIKTKLIPFVKKVGEGFKAWKQIIEALPAVFAAIKQKVVAFLEGIKDAMPDWLIPGSPTPLELGLKGIKSALEDVAPNLASLPVDQRQFFNGSTVNINNGTQMDAFESMLRGLA